MKIPHRLKSVGDVRARGRYILEPAARRFGEDMGVEVLDSGPYKSPFLRI